MSQSETAADGSNSKDLKLVYGRSILNSFSSGTVGPFLSVYAVKLGASASEMGWFQSVANLAPNMMQVPWGKLSDKIGKRVLFIIAGGLITAVLWIPLMFVTSPTQLIGVIALQAVLGSMAIPTWTAFLGELMHSSRRGVTTASLNRYAAVGSLLATLAAGYLMIMIKGTLQQMFLIPLLVAVVCGIVSSLLMFLVHEKPHPNNSQNGSIFGMKDVIVYVRGNPSFVRFLSASILFGFFMSLSWPLFSITTIDVLNASMLEVALISVVQSAFTITLQPWAGRLVDRVGRRQLIVAYRLGLVLVPTLYGLASEVYHLYIAGVIFGVIVAFGDIAMFAYLLDITQGEMRGTLTAFYNLVTGIVFFIGSLSGGYLANYLIGIFGLVFGLQLTYAISAIGRFAGGLSFTTLKEPRTYPSTLRKELGEIVHKLPLVPDRGPANP
jgi:MFS family permease